MDQDQDILILWGICVLRVTCIDSLKTSNTTFCLNIESLAGVSMVLQGCICSSDFIFWELLDTSKEWDIWLKQRIFKL